MGFLSSNANGVLFLPSKMDIAAIGDRSLDTMNGWFQAACVWSTLDVRAAVLIQSMPDAVEATALGKVVKKLGPSFWFYLTPLARKQQG